MGRRRGGRPVHGWVVVDKPREVTSVAVVAAVRRATGAAKAGHSGTLDPLATGVLPVALGEATKTIPYLVDGSKSYRFTVRWGERRDTDDAEGQVIARSEARPDAKALEQALAAFTGTIDQVPPVYSAIKVDGRRAYALARDDVPVVLKARPVVIERIELVGMPDRDHAEFAVVCGKGAYMRALARDIAEAVGTVGHVVGLRRTAVGPFGERDAIALDKLQALGHSEAALQVVLPVAAALADIPAVTVTVVEARKLQRGQAIAVLPVAQRSPYQVVTRDSVVCAMAEDKPVALAHIKGGEIRPLRVLNL
ncbi:MAG: tRNA pseudouridine(55) synthase TruB [Rhodospirillales bacterium]|nr:MAG: tRNA pseudouridine(55) synthase TruB [Rhodospirillales bacterium]